MTLAITPGTFDPITYGHLDIIKRATSIFDEVLVAVAISTPKHTLFDIDKRVELAKLSIEELGIKNARVVSFDGLLFEFAKEQNATAIVKGLRAITDFEYEFQMNALNRQLDYTFETTFIMSPPKYMYLSSSIVRELASLNADTTKFVPPCVSEALKKKFS